MVNELSPEQQGGVESELIDLSSVSMVTLRASDDELLRRVAHQVVEQVRQIMPAVSNPSTRID